MSDLADMIHKERKDVYHAMKRARLWKRVAKKWRRYSLSSNEIFNMNAEEQMMVRETATRRKKLLRRYNDAVAFFLAHEEEYADRENDDWINMMRDLTNVMTDVARELADD